MLLEDDAAIHPVRCGECMRRMDYDSIPEVHMGAIQCPYCTAIIDQTGRVLESAYNNLLRRTLLERYMVQEKPDSAFIVDNGSNIADHTPVLTLKDEFGGISHITVDDHCYVLYNGGQDRPFRPSYHWYPEAASALSALTADDIAAHFLESDAQPKPADLKQAMKGVSLGKDKDGFYCYTHRARSKSYKTPHDIPKSVIDFIESTG